MANNVKGGGLGSKQHVRTGVKTGAARHGVNPRWTSQVGQSYGNHATERKGIMPTSKVIERYDAGAGTPSRLGNEVALNVGRGGVATGRTIYRTGSQQGMTTREIPSGRDILGDFGPEIGGRRR